MQNIDDQPIASTFFGEGKWLTDFITPEAIDVQELHADLTANIRTLDDRIVALHGWVASEVQYRKFIRGKLSIEGKVSYQEDLWNTPSITSKIKVGNCANKSFLLASLIRQELSSKQVYAVLGNLYNGKVGGHAWVQVRLGGHDYIVEPTRDDIPVFVPVASAERYEAVHLFNDQEVYVIEGRTVMEPYTACFSTWLSDYLDMAYIEGRK
jgi:transglutaminase-like putative cysteine protease